MMAAQFKENHTAVIAGPTRSGKTEFTVKSIENAIFVMDPPPDKIIWYYTEYQPKLHKRLAHLVEFRQGCPQMSDFADDNSYKWVILDDLQENCDKEISAMFTKGSHHRNMSVWFIMQNFFHKGKEIRTITLNAHYIVLFKNPRDKQQVSILARQMYGNDSQVMEQAYSLATQAPHGYLLIDATQGIRDHLRLRSKIFPGEAMEIYTSRKNFKGDHIIF